mgnify:CR=1 FL=1
MIFQHTHEWVTAVSPHTGDPKTSTARVVKEGELSIRAWGALSPVIRVFNGNDRAVYKLGYTYAVQPGRGKKAVGRIQITDIRRGDVRDQPASFYRAEGFASKQQFLDLWHKMHGGNCDAWLISFVLRETFM